LLDAIPLADAYALRGSAYVCNYFASCPEASATGSPLSCLINRRICLHGRRIAAGVVTNINRPSGNITGVSFLTVASASKRFGLLREMLAAVKVVGLLSNSTDPTAKRQIDDLEAAAHSLDITLHLAFAETEGEIDDALAMLAQRQIVAFTINGSPFFQVRMNQIIGLTARYRMPDMYGGREFAAAGGLMA